MATQTGAIDLRAAKNAYDKADTADQNASAAQTSADQAQETADSILIYDHTYALDPTTKIATFTAYLYKGGVDVKTSYNPEWFTWYLKTESGESPILNAAGNNYGYTCEVDTTECGYGAEVIGRFTTIDDATALDTEGNTLTDGDGTDYTVRATGESVRIRDLSVSTVIYPSEKVLIVGNENEHLVTVRTLSDAVDKHYVHTQATAAATWEITHNLNKYPSVTVIDSAGSEVEGDIDYTSANVVTLTFSGAFSGKAYLN